MLYTKDPNEVDNVNHRGITIYYGTYIDYTSNYTYKCETSQADRLCTNLFY